MKQIAVVSGKGGTGKTSLVAAFSNLAQPCVVADCDVDAANLHLVLSPLTDEIEKEPFYSGYLAKIDQDLCTKCGLCLKNCRFDAITEKDNVFEIMPVLCEGCGLCVDICPNEAINLKTQHAGELFSYSMRFGQLIQGKLGIAQSTSGKLVSKVREKAKDIAIKNNSELLLIDGSPGIGCPVIASLTGVDAAVIVSEPTLSGEHDLLRIAELCKHFNLPIFVIVNKYDLNSEQTEAIIETCKKIGAHFAGKINYDKELVEALSSGNTILEYSNSETSEQIRSAWEYIWGKNQELY